jgi:hypothetical protein
MLVSLVPGVADGAPQIDLQGSGFRLSGGGKMRYELPRLSLAGVGEKTETPAVAPEIAAAFRRHRGARGDGGGADVTNVEAIQTNFSDPMFGNVILVIWDENAFNPAGSITISLDGTVVQTVDGLPADQLPGGNGSFVPAVPVGMHTVVVEALDGTFGEDTINVLETQPFPDVQNLRCEEGPAAPDGTCELFLSWNSCMPFPTSNAILVNGNVLAGRGDVHGAYQGIFLAPVPANVALTFTVFGFLETPEGTYRGNFITAPSCTMLCVNEACDPVSYLRLHQTGYGAGSAVLATWQNGEFEDPAQGTLGYASVNVSVDGTPLGELPGAAEFVFVNNLEPGPHTISIQGDCDAAGLSTPSEAIILVLAATPYTNPIEGDVTCTFDPGDPLADPPVPPSTSASWMNAGCTTGIFPMVAIGGDLENLVVIDGDVRDGVQPAIMRPDQETTGGIFPTDPEDIIALLFFTTVDGQCYASDLKACGTTPPTGRKFIRGICNGLASDPNNPSPQITSAVFFFNFSFLGGPRPPCVEACNANGDRDVNTGRPILNITDGVFILNYLFLGGPPPPTWVDTTGDGRVDPTCETTTPESLLEDCEESHSFCP